jgi:trans-L-3-hydroxyproline dehydratase
MYGCILTPAVTAGADFGVLFMHNEGYSSMCGHGIIAVATAAVVAGMVEVTEPETAVTIDTPAGLVTAFATVQSGKVTRVRFHNVPSFVVAAGRYVDVAGVGSVRYDLAFGGAFYAYVDADQLGLRCASGEAGLLAEKGMAIKRAVIASETIRHPSEPELSFLYGTIFTAPPLSAGADSRHVCIFADGQVDRSPTGTGVSGRLALSFARGAIGVGQPLVIESILGTRFTGRVIRATTVGPYQAVVPEVEGSAHVTGRQEFLFDPDDPLKDGFLL